MTTGDDDFLSRWSRRKRAVEAEEAASEPAVPEASEQLAPAPEDETEEQALERLGLPDPDSLSEGDDFTGFLKSGVPDALRRRALRRLWRSNPVLANVDGLVDYGDDFTDAAMVPDVLATAYKVGQGMLKKITEDDDVEAKTMDEAISWSISQGPLAKEHTDAWTENAIKNVFDTKQQKLCCV